MRRSVLLHPTSLFITWVIATDNALSTVIYAVLHGVI